MKFENKTVVITGAAGAIGRCLSLEFAEEGANVVLVDINREKTAAVAAEIRAKGGECMEAPLDILDADAVFAMAREAEARYGQIDVLINNAGGSAALLGKISSFAAADLDTIKWVLDMNLYGSIICIKAVLDGMIARKKGKIINTSSIAGTNGLVTRVDYSAAKGGVISLTKALAMEVGRYNVNVNCIAPGAIARGEDLMKNATFLGPDGHGGRPHDIAAMAKFLASDDADFITGQTYSVDGGRTLGPMSQPKV